MTRGLFPLAWLVKSCRKGDTVEMKWNEDYSFVWSFTGGRLEPGLVFSPDQMIQADPAAPNNNRISLTFGHELAFHGRTTDASAKGNLLIQVEHTVPMYYAAAGIGMSGSSTLVQAVFPNQEMKFAANPEYRITFGHYEQGKVLDAGSVFSHPIQFPPDCKSANVVIERNNTFSVSYDK